MNNVSVNDWLTECYKCMIAKLKYESTTKNKKSDALIPVFILNTNKAIKYWHDW
jgi:hypothetical protein